MLIPAADSKSCLNCRTNQLITIMVLDQIKNVGLYEGMNSRMKSAFNSLRQTDFSKLGDGMYELEGDEVFAIVQEYETKDIKECMLEGHQKYIDIHYMLEGVELIGHAPKEGQEAVKTNEEEDYALYEGGYDLLTLSEGQFAIFYPDDLHAPGVFSDQSEKVKKVVLKVLL